MSLLVALFSATLTKVVGGTLLNPEWLGVHGIPLSDTLEKGLKIVGDQFKEHLPEVAKRLFPEEPDLKRLIEDGSLALLVARTAAGIVQTFAEEQPDGFLRDTYAELAQSLACSAKAWNGEVRDIFGPETMRNAAAWQFAGGEANPPTPPLDAEDWQLLLRPLVPLQPPAAWNPNSQAKLTDAQLLPVAERLRDRFLADVPAALAREENATAYRRVLHATLGEGFGGLFARLTNVQNDLRTIQAGLTRLTTPHTRRSFPRGSPYAFQNELARFQGREREFGRASAFLADRRPFLWWRVVGPAGSGKSRFAQEVVDRARFAGWEAGWINWTTEKKEAGLVSWQAWDPDRPVLVVFDDALDHPERLAQILSVLGDRARDEWPQAGKRVRFLALARESGPVRWNGLTRIVPAAEVQENLYTEPGTSPPSTNGFDRKVVDETFGPETALALAPLEAPDFANIVADVWDALAPADQSLAPGRADDLRARLAATPGLLHPLYVQIAVEVMIRGDEDAAAPLGREGLVEYVVRREEERWVREGVSMPYRNLALLGCLWERLDALGETGAFAPPPESSGPLFPRPPESDLAASALSLASGFDDRDYLVRKFEPDVLGELYALRRLLGRSFDSNRIAHLEAKAIWNGAKPLKLGDDVLPPDAAERLRRERAMAFVFRVFDSFPDLARAAGLEEALDDPQRLALFALRLEHARLVDHETASGLLESGSRLATVVDDPFTLKGWGGAVFNTHLRLVRTGDRTAAKPCLDELRSLSSCHLDVAEVHTFLAQALADAHLAAYYAGEEASMLALLDELRSLAKTFPSDAEVAGPLARALFARHTYLGEHPPAEGASDALTQLRALASASPSSAEAQEMLANALLNEFTAACAAHVISQAEALRREMEALRKAHPGNDEVRRYLARLYLVFARALAEREVVLMALEEAFRHVGSDDLRVAFDSAYPLLVQLEETWSITQKEIEAIVTKGHARRE